VRPTEDFLATPADVEVHPRRSVLYAPGSNERALQKAATLPVDGVILDLEDAVAPDRKATARELVCAATASDTYGMREVAIRVNAAGTPWYEEDLRAACAVAPNGLVLPKVTSPDDVHAAEAAVDAAGGSDRTRLWVMIETPRAVLECAKIAAASERVAVLVLGTNDLIKELGVVPVADRTPLLMALSTCVLGARAAGVAVLDGVYNDVRDVPGFEAECVQGRQLGFDGKTLIHPGQVEVANRVFAPTESELETARRTIDAYEGARAEGRGVATLDGRLIESLHVETARRSLALHEAVARRG
jgi:citrate lyase subunit beta/citryl-CoA lyase